MGTPRHQAMRPTAGATSSDLAAPGHLPQRGRLLLHGQPHTKWQGCASCIAATSSGRPRWGQRERPHPTSLRSAAFPGGEGFCCMGSPTPNGRGAQAASQRPLSAGHAGDSGSDLIRPRCARPPSPEGKAFLLPDMRRLHRIPRRKQQAPQSGWTQPRPYTKAPHDMSRQGFFALGGLLSNIYYSGQTSCRSQGSSAASSGITGSAMMQPMAR